MFRNINYGIMPNILGGTQKVSMVYIDDLVTGILLAAEKEKAEGQIFNISGDEQLEWREIGKIMAKAMNKMVLEFTIPIWFLNMACHLNVGLSKISNKPPLLNRDKIKEMKQSSWLLSNEKAQRELGYRPKFTLLNGFQQTAEWYIKNGWL